VGVPSWLENASDGFGATFFFVQVKEDTPARTALADTLQTPSHASGRLPSLSSGGTTAGDSTVRSAGPLTPPEGVAGGGGSNHSRAVIQLVLYPSCTPSVVSETPAADPVKAPHAPADPSEDAVGEASAAPSVGPPSSSSMDAHPPEPSSAQLPTPWSAVLLDHGKTAVPSCDWLPSNVTRSDCPFRGLLLGPALGRGSFGRVYRGVYMGGPVAVKVGRKVERGKPGHQLVSQRDCCHGAKVMR